MIKVNNTYTAYNTSTIQLAQAIQVAYTVHTSNKDNKKQDTPKHVPSVNTRSIDIYI